MYISAKRKFVGKNSYFPNFWYFVDKLVLKQFLKSQENFCLKKTVKFWFFYEWEHKVRNKVR